VSGEKRETKKGAYLPLHVIKPIDKSKMRGRGNEREGGATTAIQVKQQASENPAEKLWTFFMLRGEARKGEAELACP